MEAVRDPHDLAMFNEWKKKYKQQKKRQQEAQRQKQHQRLASFQEENPSADECDEDNPIMAQEMITQQRQWEPSINVSDIFL